MLRIKLLAVLLCSAILSAIACSPSAPVTPNTGVTIALLTQEVSIPSAGGEYVIELVSTNDWRATTQQDWIQIGTNSGSAGLNDVEFNVLANGDDSPRNGYITFQNSADNNVAVLTITQEKNVLAKCRLWSEMPEMVENANWEYCLHDKLSSNSKLRNYSFCFDKSKHCALWVAYPLHTCYTEGNGKRTNAWGYDPCCIDDNLEPNLKNAYYPQGGSSYSHSRGHQLPSADRLASNEDNATTFYYTNMTPQLQALNGSQWGALEGELRSKWMCSDTLYVVTGAHFAQGYGYAYDNKGAGKPCAVPTHYYKVILRTKSGNSGKWVQECSADELQCVGFWFDHSGGATRQTMSVAEIEKKTGFTFFSNVKSAPKSTYNPSDWN